LRILDPYSVPLFYLTSRTLAARLDLARFKVRPSLAIL